MSPFRAFFLSMSRLPPASIVVIIGWLVVALCLCSFSCFLGSFDQAREKFNVVAREHHLPELSKEDSYSLGQMEVDKMRMQLLYTNLTREVQTR